MEISNDFLPSVPPWHPGVTSAGQIFEWMPTDTKDRFEDLMDLGLNMEARFSGQVFQTAGVLLGHAITAKQAKLDKKLRMINLQLQKAKFDHQVKKDAKAGASDVEEAEDGQGVILDRNALLAQILGKGTDSK